MYTYVCIRQVKCKNYIQWRNVGFTRKLIDRKAISRFILNSHAAALQGCRRATTVVTPTEAKKGVRKSEEGKGETRLHIHTRLDCAHTYAHIRESECVLTYDRGKGSLPLSSPGRMGCQFWARLRTRRIR